jgi:fructose-bisphosphate aldolase class 1
VNAKKTLYSLSNKVIQAIPIIAWRGGAGTSPDGKYILVLKRKAMHKRFLNYSLSRAQTKYYMKHIRILERPFAYSNKEYA